LFKIFLFSYFYISLFTDRQYIFHNGGDDDDDDGADGDCCRVEITELGMRWWRL